MHTIKPVLIGAILLALIFMMSILFRSLNDGPVTPKSPLVGQKVPHFELVDVKSGKKFSHKDLKGRVSILNFWATWCPSCVECHQEFIELSKRQDLHVFSVAYYDTHSKVQAWFKEKGNPYQKSGIDDNGTVGIDFGIRGTPEVFIIDEKGVIVHHHLGSITPDFIEVELSKYSNAHDSENT